MDSSHRTLALCFLGFVGCSSSGSGGGVGVDGGATGGIGNTGATGGSTGGVSGNGGTPTGGAGGLSGGTGGVGGVAGGVSGGTGGTAGASGECQQASECPGSDTECSTRTCVNQICGVDHTPAGFVVAAQTAGDCLEQICDGQGQVMGQADNADVENDNNDCTTDSCASGSPTHTPKSPGASCTGSGGAKVCNAAQVCVQCIAPTDCTSGVCTTGFTCAQASCTDLTKNGAESDIDCGGATCPKCQAGQSCNGPTDCTTNTCTGGTCACIFVPNSLILSEVKWRGTGGAQDDFVELYNPGNASVTLTSAWTIESRSETAGSYTIRFTGANQVIPPHEHFLIVGSTPSFTGDASLSSGITDEASVVLKNGASVVDAVCWNCGTNSFTDHVCQGAPVTVTNCASASDRSIERKPGGTLGNCSDTNSPDDWQLITPSIPQNLSSPPTP
jgi:hypothetical protein